MPTTFTPYYDGTHPIGSGTQKLYRFENGYGASVVQFSIGGMAGSYGAESGLWELAVLEFTGDGAKDFELTYDTPITEDALGRLTLDEVDEILGRIAALDKNGDS